MPQPVYRFSPDFGAVEKITTNISAWSLLEDNNGNYWFGTGEGPYTYTPETAKLEPYKRYNAFGELAEAFGMMMVKVEAREFRLKQMIEELEKTEANLQEGIDGTNKP